MEGKELPALSALRLQSQSSDLSPGAQWCNQTLQKDYQKASKETGLQAALSWALPPRRCVLSMQEAGAARAPTGSGSPGPGVGLGSGGHFLR